MKPHIFMSRLEGEALGEHLQEDGQEVPGLSSLAFELRFVRS